MKTYFIIIAIIVLLGLVGVGIYFYSTKEPIEDQIAHSPCLSDDEIVDFPINEYYSGEYFKYPKFPLVIYIRDKNTKKEKFHFQIDGVRENYYPLEIHKCGVYVIRQFNYDPQKIKQGLTQELGYREEFWRYDYSGRGESLLLLAEKPKEFISYYSPDFRVDPREVYVALVRGYLESEDYALVIRDLNAQTDNFVLLRQILLGEYPELLGYFGLEKWTKNGDYFWGNLSIAANEIAYLRILRDIWRFDVLPVPSGTLGGTAFNPEFGYMTYDTGPGWIGIHEMAEQIYDEWRKEGKKVDFYVYSLFTKEKTLLATTDDPSWSFKPQWLSDTELEYYIPPGEKKIYKLENKAE